LPLTPQRREGLDELQIGPRVRSSGQLSLSSRRPLSSSAETSSRIARAASSGIGTPDGATRPPAAGCRSRVRERLARGVAILAIANQQQLEPPGPVGRGGS